MGQRQPLEERETSGRAVGGRSLFRRTVFLAGRIVEPAHEEPRWLLLGETNTGRRLALIFTRRGRKLRPISCRQMRRNERKLYEEAKLETGSEEDR